ncbi:DUF5359 family protein [Bacillus cytotoxicus]|uniref:DUF5359 family protein n=1 Tax=Bacillus cereus group TaxID=86661 RepID=UPI000B352A76|nr:MULTISPECIES: DUF5359 family protein [Bacillus cereus group]AWC34862.1 hypothetical protein CG482_007105 [Bacillus cytotoxicus]AWC38860.1 hypothetical protein CG481_007120 [Bacillus cytotoxicus]AWC63077.1 hypothetical protein CG474_007180 [Bacillus cytotoxicus]MDH2879327.1 YpfB family protein [Bacillus cytotoxicus]MDH2886850.1 YpfB family protein [Bacillus cytotoxicus]
MKKVEKFIIHILIVQFICICLTQLLLMQGSSIKYLSKIVYYEGVMLKTKTDILEVNK